MSRTYSSLFFLAVVACAPEGAELASDAEVAPPPPYDLELETTPFVAGHMAQMMIHGAPPNKDVAILFSHSASASPACPAPMAPACLDIANPATLFKVKKADGMGNVTVALPVPATPPFVDFELQAVSLAGGMRLSPPVDVHVHAPDSDEDNDLLTAEEEIAAGTDPGNPDSDNGGLDDGPEIISGHDPLDPNDDNFTPTYTWTNDIKPGIIDMRCSGCHTNGGMSGGVHYDHYTDMVGHASVDVPSIDLVRPWLPEESYVWHKVNGTQTSVPGGGGARMPFNGPPYLSAGDLAKIETWIREGAPE